MESGLRKVLFYPCCGSDLEEPLKFMDQIDEFWFVDLGSIPNLDPDVKKPLLNSRHEYGLTDFQTLDLAPNDPKVTWSSPCIRETYEHPQGKRLIVIHRVQGKGVTTMKHSIPSIDIFFYRGDSPGDGGSNNYWLGKTLFPKVLERLVDGGYIVTDGSNGCKKCPWRKLRKFHRKDIREEAVEQAEPFKARGRYFERLGYVGNRFEKGPTLIWRVTKIPNPLDA